MLTGQVAIVTGAARGIGKAIALELASLGADIVINDISVSDEANELKNDIEKMGRKAEIICSDISKSEEALSLVKETKEKLGRIDILVNNAGITRDNLLLKMSEADFDAVINVNLKGTFNCIKHVTPIMLKQRGGKIINMASVVALMGNAGQANYCASKAGIIGLTRSAARELGSKSITVNAVAPGFINTKMTDVLPEEVKNNYMKEIPLKKFGEVEDIAKTVAFLASDAANYITGQVISVNGGLYM